jgi:thiol-disulfide isomerase/thioredoxin
MAADETQPTRDDDKDAPKPRGWRMVLRFAKEAAILLVIFVVLSTVMGRLRAPDFEGEAPAFRLATLDGEQVALEDFRGKTVVLNFWATWCGPCRVEIPSFSKFAREHPDIPVLGIAVDGRADDLRVAAKKLGIEYPVLVGTRDVVSAYGASTVPTTVVVGPDGSVKTAHVGVMTGPQLWLATR